MFTKRTRGRFVPDANNSMLGIPRLIVLTQKELRDFLCREIDYSNALSLSE